LDYHEPMLIIFGRYSCEVCVIISLFF